MNRSFEMVLAYNTNKKSDIQAFYLLEMFIYENQKSMENICVFSKYTLKTIKTS